MFDHVVFGVRDYAASKAFYLKALEPLGVAIVQEGALGLEISADGKSSLCIWQTKEKPARLHLAFRAGNRHYHANYYAAFVIGPDGHNIEVVCREPEARPF